VCVRACMHVRMRVRACDVDIRPYVRVELLQSTRITIRSTPPELLYN